MHIFRTLSEASLLVLLVKNLPANAGNLRDASVDSISHSPFNSPPLSLIEYEDCDFSDDKLNFLEVLYLPHVPFSSPFTEFRIHSLTIISEVRNT